MTSSPHPELPAIGFLSDVDPSHRAFLASYGKFVRPANGEYLIHEEKPQDSLFLVLSGLLHVITGAGGRNLFLAALGSGDSIGDIAVFDPGPASASVVAKSDCVIWRISGDDLHAAFEADPVSGIEFMKGLLKLQGSRLRTMISKVADSEEKAALHTFWKSGE